MISTLPMVRCSDCMACEYKRCPLVAALMLAHRSWTWLPICAEEGPAAQRDCLKLLTRSALSLISIKPVLLLTTPHRLTACDLANALHISTHSCPSDDDTFIAPSPPTFRQHMQTSESAQASHTSDTPMSIHGSMSVQKDNTFGEMPGPMSNHEPGTETMSELADDMAPGMKISTSETGQKNAIGAEKGSHEARL